MASAFIFFSIDPPAAVISASYALQSILISGRLRFVTVSSPDDGSLPIHKSFGFNKYS